MESAIVTLTGLTVAEGGLLATAGIRCGEDLSMVSFDDISDLLTEASIVKRRKLSHISAYLSRGQIIDDATTMPSIMSYLNTPVAPVVNNPLPPPYVPPPPDPTRGALRLSVNSIDKFSGSPLDFEEWELKTRATLGQTTYATFLTTAPVAGDQAQTARNRELYNMFVTALHQGSGMHLLNASPNDDGHGAWQEIMTWYGSTATSRFIIDHYRNKLESLRLDGSTEASTYVNDFIICSQKLEAKSEGYTAETKRQKFLDQIVDGDYEVSKQLLGDATTTFDQCVQRIRTREQELGKEVEGTLKNKARRFKSTNDSETNSVSGPSDDNKIPSIPGYILYKIKPENVKKDLIRWRGIYNSEGRIIRANELAASSGKEGQDDGVSRKKSGDDSAANGSGKERNSGGDKSKSKKRKSFKQRRVKVVRRTTTAPSGTKDAPANNSGSTITVDMKDVDDDELNSGDENDDEENTSGQDEPSVEESKKKRKSKKQRKKQPSKNKSIRRNPISRRGRTGIDLPRGIIDPGTEIDVIGGIGWHVLSKVDNMSAQLDGALAGMGERTLPLVRAVTAYDHEKGGTILLGVGCAGYDDRAEQTESLFNSHDLRKNGIIVHDTTKRDGGEQRLEVDGIEIQLDFVDNKTLSFKLRAPTATELEELQVHWLSPRRPDLKSGNGSAIRRQPAAIVPVQAPWDERLGNSPEMITVKTLAATTQLCDSPVEMDKREAPRQHRKKRVLALHPKRIAGRTDSDTFFSSVKSIRGYTCIQIFFCCAAKFIFARCMRKERESHGAYQDLIREVGAPNLLLTDNAQTETGKKWTKTSRDNATRQVKTVPHNQNQNNAERKIQDVKRRTILTLRYAAAPLVFWCYCMSLVIDCLNHSAQKELEYRTAMEKMFGHTPDISMFRFPFWCAVWYFEPTAKYPKSNFLPGRMIGIAWDHGDAFSYKIWTTPDDDWTKGVELIRNVVKTRHVSEVEPRADYDESSISLSKGKTKRSKKKREQQSKKRTRAEEGKEQEEEPKRKRLVSFSKESPKTHTTDLGEKGDSVGQGNNQETTTTTTFQNDLPATAEMHTSTINSKRNRDEESTSEAFQEFNPLEYEEEVEMQKEVNDAFPTKDSASSGIGGAHVAAIIGHNWIDGRLKLKVEWNTEQSSWEELPDMKEDYPKMTAHYLVDANVTTRSQRGDRMQAWAKKTLRDISRTARRMVRLYDFHLDENEEVYSVRRASTQTNKKKKKKYDPKPQFKYGVKVPRTIKQAIDLDAANGNNLWQESIKLEIQALTDLECFDFKDPDHKCGPQYQRTTLMMIFGVKQDLRHKARLVAGGHLVDALDHDIYSSTVKGVSVKLLHVIAHKTGMTQLCGDVGNAYVNAFTNEKVYAVAGKEFGEMLEGSIIIIRKALYGLRTSSERWYSHFADSLRGIGFTPTRYDNDVWIRLNKDGNCYDYICTHVDDFMIVGTDPTAIMKMIQAIYAVKSIGPPDYYLGNDYKLDSQGRWCIGCKKYLMEAIKRVERMFGALKKHSHPMETGDHPEMDESEIMDDEGHRKYQMLMGILVWVVTIGRIDVAHSTSSLSRFTACPRKGHETRALRVFGYLKKRPNRRIVVDSRDPIYKGGEDALDLDFTKELATNYPDSFEEIDVNLPEALIDEMEITVFVDSDHAHDKVSRRSITGIIIFVGRTPVIYSSKRQGAIETSTYGAEFCAMKNAVEELIALRYMLRCLGVKVEHASLICGDNMGVIQNATISESLLKKKHVAISYHKTREAAAAGIAHPIKTGGADNYADVLTKPQTLKCFSTLVGGFMYG